MCNHNRQRINNCVAIYFGHFLIFGKYPLTGDTIGRFNCFYAVNLSCRFGRFQRKIVIHQDFPSCNLFPLDLDHILVGIEAAAVPKTDGRYDHTHFLGILSSENNDTVYHFAPAGFIHKRYQAVAEFHFYRIHSYHGIHIVDILEIFSFVGSLLLFFNDRSCNCSCFLLCRLFRLPVEEVPGSYQPAAQQKHLEFRHSRHQKQYEHDTAGHHNCLRLCGELLGYIIVQASF